MKCLVLFAVLSLLPGYLFSQSGHELTLPSTDTLRFPGQVNFPALPVYGSLETELPLSLLMQPLVEVPSFDISRYLKSNWTVAYPTFSDFGRPPSLSSALSDGFPLFHAATVFNQATYRLGEKFLLGGNSFGVQSILSAPLPHPAAGNWDTRGASMFMQYKVNRNFRIETRFSISGSNYQP